MALQTAATTATRDAVARRAIGLGAAVGASLVAGAAILSGCMQQRAPAPPGVAATVGPKAGFFFNRTDDVVTLAYGLPNSDAVTLMLHCEAGKRAIEITDAGHRDAKAGQMLTLASGHVQSALPVKLASDEESGGALAVAHASPDLPALDGFRRTGLISVKMGEHQYVLIASGDEKSGIARFFAACERK
jgi:hypothetical protein